MSGNSEDYAKQQNKRRFHRHLCLRLSCIPSRVVTTRSPDCHSLISRFMITGNSGTVGKSVNKILVVEDDRAIQKALKRIFESEDYVVEITCDGKAGLEAFRASTPSAVVL